MTIEEFEKAVLATRIHRSARQGPALKKPLLLLVCLARIIRRDSKANAFTFSELSEELTSLINQFGGRTSSPAPAQPFWHMNSDPYWTLHLPPGTEYSARSTGSMAILRDRATYAELPEEIFAAVKDDASTADRLVRFILDHFWPTTVHEDILSALGLYRESNSSTEALKPGRAGGFARAVLQNYSYACAFCEFTALLNAQPFGLDAAHIRARCYDGPDETSNGLALCKLHHWAFDRGAMSVGADLEILVSPSFIVQSGPQKQLMADLKGRRIGEARETEPDPEFIDYHRNFIFLK